MDDHSFARLIYLLLLGAAIAVGVFAAYRGRASTGLRDAAVWGMIILGLVALYGLKDDLRAALIPGEAVRGAEGAVVLRRAPDGHFHLRAEVNGQPVRFLVDTGATDVVLTRDDAARAGLDPATLAYTRRAMTANGAVMTAPVRLERLSVNDLETRDVSAVVGGDGLFQSLLGMSWLDRFRRISVEGDRMILEP